MSATNTYPGVYIQELASPVHPIAAAPTSITAFVGYTASGIDNRAQTITSWNQYEQLFGGLASNSELSYAVSQFYQKAGNTLAIVVRVPMHGATGATVVLDSLTFTALSSGSWADGMLLIDVDVQNVNLTADALAFNLTVTNLAPNGTTESFPNVTLNSAASNYIDAVVNDPDNGSQLVKVTVGSPAPTTAVPLTGVVGSAITAAGVTGAMGGATADADYLLTITTSQPSTAPQQLAGPLSVTVFTNGTPLPQTLSGIAAQVQAAINGQLTASYPSASVQCSVTPLAAGGQALRVNAQLPNLPDAVLEFAGNGATPLGLQGATANVAHYALGTGHDGWGSQTTSTAGSDGSGLPTTADFINNQAQFEGIYALLKVPAFNLLCIPDATRAMPGDPTTLDDTVTPSSIFGAALALCDQQRAFLLVDPTPDITTVAGAIDWITTKIGISDPNGNGAGYWPRVRLPDPNNNYNLRTFAPSALVAGVYVAGDGNPGVWAAPAGIQATLSGVQAMTYSMNDLENGQLNPLGCNCLRTFPSIGPVVWGARTIAGADVEASQWKYVPIRRMALFLESSLYQGTQWVVFQPNDEALWASIRLNITAFMQTYFLKEAFAGQTPDQAYYVKCDADNNPPSSVAAGVVNILVGFAPLYPAEFVDIQIEQLAGQSAS